MHIEQKKLKMICRKNRLRGMKLFQAIIGLVFVVLVMAVVAFSIVAIAYSVAARVH